MNGLDIKVAGRGVKHLVSAFAWLLAAAMPVFGAVETDLSKNGISLTVTASPDSVDVARDFEVVVKAVAPTGTVVALPWAKRSENGYNRYEM